MIMKGKPMNKWLKRLVILIVVAIALIFFGSIVFVLLGYVSDFASIFFGWIATAFRWLAKLFDIFGFTAIFSATADAQVVEQTISMAKVIIGG